MSFVVTDGQIASIDRPAPLWRTSVQVSDTLTQDYATIWRTQPQVRTVIGFLGRNIAQLGIHVFRRMSDTDRQRLADHPLATLLGRPNPRTTRYRFIDALVQDMGIYDNAVLLKSIGEGQTRGLIRLPPKQITPMGGDWLSPAFFRLRGKNGYKDLTPDQVVHFRGYNPDDSRWGISPMETLRRVLAEEYAAGTYREQLWRNGARFPGYIKRPATAPEWGDGARERFRNDWRGLYTGDGPGAGGTPILEDDMSFEASGITPEQAQYLETRKLTREEVAAAFHIPLPMVGILDHATFSNISEQHKNLYQDTLGPWLTMIQEEIELQLLPDMGDTTGVYVEFNLAEKMRGSFEEQATSLQSSTGAPIMTRNEGRARINLPRLDDPAADQLVTPLNVLVGGQASPNDTAPPPKRRQVRVKARVGKPYADKAQEVLAGFFARQGAAISSKLGAKSAKAAVDDVFDAARWDRELAADLLSLNLSTATAAAKAALEALAVHEGTYDEDITIAWLEANASGVASGINATTKANVATAIAGSDPVSAVKDLFAMYAASRAAQLAVTHATAMSGFGTEEAARQSGHKATKTWVTGPKARASHAQMSGETVNVGELFSNGAKWPGDSVLGADEIAGCNCSLDINVEA